jgi:hypothetical protein
VVVSVTFVRVVGLSADERAFSKNSYFDGAGVPMRQY